VRAVPRAAPRPRRRRFPLFVPRIAPRRGGALRRRLLPDLRAALHAPVHEPEPRRAARLPPLRRFAPAARGRLLRPPRRIGWPFASFVSERPADPGQAF